MPDQAELQRITVTEFARRVGCDPKQVRRWISAGKLSKDGAGGLDAAVVPAWRSMHAAGKSKSDRRSSKGSRTKPGHSSDIPDTSPEQLAAEALLAGTGVCFEEARRLREFYSMKLLQYEYDLKAGAVVAAADVAQILGAECAKVRTKLLAVPSTWAPRVHRCKSVAEVQDAMHEAIHEALTELVCDTAAL